MRFSRCPRMPFEWTARKAAAVLRRQARERADLPLFAADVAADQPSVDEVREHRERSWGERQRAWRSLVAALWRRARRALRALPPEVREACLARWNAAGCPADAAYFGDRVWQTYRALQLVGPGHSDSEAEYAAAVEALEAERQAELAATRPPGAGGC